MKIDKVYCLFEQSGTFKMAFKNLGYEAEDYDILNDFGQTDHIIDLFAEIEKAYDGKPSLFDEITKNDLIFAFFPCTRFEDIIPISFRGEQPQQAKWPDEQKLAYSMKLHDELHDLYVLICKLFIVAIRGGYQLVVENPYSPIHYLKQYFPIKPAVVIKNRHDEGDYYKKPTQFYFVNCTPEQNVVFEPINNEKRIVLKRVRADTEQIDAAVNRYVRRSLIHPQFADRFIKTYILTKEGNIWL